MFGFGRNGNRPGSSGASGQSSYGQHQDLLQRFGSVCPVCEAVLGDAKAPEVDPRTGLWLDPPSFLLEIGDVEGRAKPWRITPLPIGIAVSRTSEQPPFRSAANTYLLCGKGHIYPLPSLDLSGGPAQRIDDVNMIAAIGAPASGKTYLMVRALQQSLDNTAKLPTGDVIRIKRHKLRPLEATPIRQRSRDYAVTVNGGRAIPPTGTDDDCNPAGILERENAEVLDVIRGLISEQVVDGPIRAARWGREYRQPLVIRTTSGDQRRHWTGVADLAGEVFRPDGGSRRQITTLQAFDALVWVVDPAVAVRVDTWLGSGRLASSDEEYGRLLDGSLRPGTVAGVRGGFDELRRTRRQIQVDIGHSLTQLEGDLKRPDGTLLPVLVAITKCDLIHLALSRGRRLFDLGAQDVVLRGAQHYLDALSRPDHRRSVQADPACGQLLSYLSGAERGAEVVRQGRCEQVAAALLEYYSDPARFWDLVHVGLAEQVVVPGGAHGAWEKVVIPVPSIEDHLDAARRPGSADRLLMRDLVMSAVGCGIGFGLGYQDALFELLDDKSEHPRLFLCSPLGTVPVGTGGEHMAPQPGVSFEEIYDRSAALTQLLLAILRKVRR